jgi:hypothetical protein
MVVPSSEKREQVLKLIAEKDKLEEKIKSQCQILQAVSIMAFNVVVPLDFSNLTIF